MSEQCLSKLWIVLIIF